jgi:REP element-mobilizing transposase RayT
MARPLRLEYPGAVYHLTSRGNAREAVYLDDEDREGFLEVLGEAVARYGWRCHAYCLMDNHYHLLVETPEPNLSLGMRHLNGVSTQRFNRRHGRVGHRFQGRFKAILVDRDRYLLELARYIVLNPVRAGVVKDAAAYPWSSYCATAGQAPYPVWLTRDWVLRQFAKTRTVAQRRYAQFVAEGQEARSPWSLLKGQVILGSEAFVAQMQPILEGKGDLKEIPRAQRLAHRPDLHAVFSRSVLAHKAARDEAIRRAYLEYGYTMAAIARQVGVHYSTVSKVIQGER